MDNRYPDTLALLQQFRPEELIPAMLEVRAEMLEAGDTPEEVTSTLLRMCTLLGVDPADLRSAMH